MPRIVHFEIKHWKDLCIAELGESGWFVVACYVVLAVVFWHFRDRLAGTPCKDRKNRIREEQFINPGGHAFEEEHHQ